MLFRSMDYLDEYKKSTGSAENMRSQIQDYIADAARAKLAEDKVRTENETLRRENDALREQLARLQAKQKADREAYYQDLASHPETYVPSTVPEETAGETIPETTAVTAPAA